MDFFVGWDGLHQGSWRANGDELLGSALRPYGFHVGNLTPILVYPYLLFDKFRRARNQEPRFTYKIWLNDIEPLSFVREQKDNENSKLVPTQTFQFTPAPNNFPGSLTDYWQPVIEGVVRGIIQPEFPEVKLEFHRTSELLRTEEFEKAIYYGIRHKKQIAGLFRLFTREHRKGLDDFVWPLCPECKTPTKNAKFSYMAFLSGKKIAGSHNAAGSCGTVYSNADEGDWAMHVRLLQVARLAIEKPDYWFIGVDHFPVSRSPFLERLADILGLKSCETKLIHTPLLLGKHEIKISKSRGNAAYMDPMELIRAMRGGRGTALYLRSAPLSSDILALGADLLPSHVKQNEAERLAVLAEQAAEYHKNEKHHSFNYDVGLYYEGRTKVNLSTGCPHLG